MRRAVVLLAAAAGMAAQSTSTTADTEPDAWLHGVVREEANGALLSGITIQVGGYSGTSTNENGAYSIKIPRGTYRVTASRGTIEPVSRTITVRPGEDADVSFVVPARPTISGRVVDS